MEFTVVVTVGMAGLLCQVCPGDIVAVFVGLIPGVVDPPVFIELDEVIDRIVAVFFSFVFG